MNEYNSRVGYALWSSGLVKNTDKISVNL